MSFLLEKCTRRQYQFTVFTLRWFPGVIGFMDRGRQEELTARLMGLVEPKLAGGLKMKAFYESPYGGDAVTGLMNHQVRAMLGVGWRDFSLMRR